MPPKFNRRRAVFVLGKIDEILAWEQRAVLFSEWSACQSQGLHYSNRDSWDRMLRQGIMLLTRFCQDDRVQVRQPRRNLQIKFTRAVDGKNDFVAYIDAIGRVDGTRVATLSRSGFRGLDASCPPENKRLSGFVSQNGAPVVLVKSVVCLLFPLKIPQSRDRPVQVPFP